ncbi:MAG: pyridoxal phosphate-dependent aminotransferase [Pseudomonadota bacterium]
MRTDLVHANAGELTYEIRNIVNVAEKLQALGAKTNMENIGDPIAKGEKIPLWMKEIVAELTMEDCNYGYCHTRGLLETRKFLADRTNMRGGAQIGPDDILFFNGLGEAIAKIYGMLNSTARILCPAPTYSTHSSAEEAHAGAKPVSFKLGPRNNWYPDLDEMRNCVKYNPAIAGILIINPDNPTGAVYPPESLKEIVSIAKEYDLFLICDEVYINIVYNGQKTVPICDVIGDVPAIAMRGISKEFPWPGSRCGWIEVYNGHNDPNFERYVQFLLNAKMVEVCSTTLPQKALPRLMSHEKYPEYLNERVSRYEKFSNIAYERLKKVPGILVNRTNGAFYMSVAFEEGRMNSEQVLPINNEDVRRLVENLVSAPGVSLDKRFVYYLLGSTGICVVPLTSFSTDLQGFRVTLLERDENEFRRIFDVLAGSIESYLNS